MKLAKKLLGIAAIFAVIGFMVLPLTGCPDAGENVAKSAVVPGDTRQTPKAEDFDIGNLTQEKGNDIVPVTITAKPEKSDGDITIYYNNSKTLPTEIGTYPVTFDVAETDDWKAAYGLSAGTLSIVERIFTDITDLGTWLSQQEANDKDTPYSIALDVSDISTLRTTLNSNPNKYVSIVLPDKITTIPNRLFIGNAAPYGCDTLTGITIPNSVTNIGDSAFSICANLSDITIGNSVTSIRSGAFRYCTSLTNVTIPDSVTSIEGYAFANCTNLTSINIPNSVTSIEYNVFSDCTSLTSIIIPDGVTSIGRGAFSGCTSLTSVTIGNSVTNIGNAAFSGCTALTTMTIPNSVIEVGDDVFKGTPWFDNQPEGVFYIGGIAVGYVGTATGDIQFKEGTKIIAKSIFYNQSGITSVTIPNSVTSIGPEAFSGCKGLTSVTIPNSVTSIGRQAFYNCTNLTSVTIPNSVTSIEYSVFASCTNLTSIIIPDSVTSIGQGAFAGCTSLTSIIIPDSVTSIGQEVFAGCTSLTSIIIPDSVTSIGEQAFSGTGLTSVTIPDSVTSIRQNAFASYELTSVSIGKGIIDISDVINGFGNSMKLATITIDSANPGLSAQDNIVYNKDKTAILFVPRDRKGEVSIPDSVTDIEDVIGLFGWDWLETQPEGVIYVGKIAIGYIGTMPANTSITLLDGIKSINSNAFSNCTNLTNIIIPNSVTIIGLWAFERCTNLTSVTIPNSVTSIGSGAFSGCTGLTSVTIGNSVTSIGNSAFSGCTGLTSINIPNSVTSIGRQAFSDCTNLTSVTFNSTITVSNFSDDSPFQGDLRAKYLAAGGGIGTYTRPDTTSTTWTKISD